MANFRTAGVVSVPPAVADTQVAYGTGTGISSEAAFAYDASTNTLTAGNVTVSGLTAGRVPYAGTGGALSDEAAFAYDAANNRLTVENVLLNGATAVASSAVRVLGSKTVASGASAVWDAVAAPASTLTLTGTTQVTTAKGMNLIDVAQPTLTDAEAVTVDQAATMYIAAAPAAGGSVTLTNPRALWVDAGIARFDGNGTHVFEVPATANNAQNVTVGNVGPGGAAVDIKAWLAVKVGSDTRYIPLFGAA